MSVWVEVWVIVMCVLMCGARAGRVGECCFFKLYYIGCDVLMFDLGE